MVRKVLVLLAVSGLSWASAAQASERDLKAFVGSYLEIQATARGRQGRWRQGAGGRDRAEAAKMGATGTAIAKAAKAMEKCSRSQGGARGVRAAQRRRDRRREGRRMEGLAGTSRWRYCPMVNAFVAAEGSQIRNPYYGVGDADLRGVPRPEVTQFASLRIARAPSTGPGTSSRNAHRQPIDAATAGSSRMLIIVSRNPAQV